MNELKKIMFYSICIFILSGCVTLNSNLNYSPPRDRANIGQGVKAYVEQMRDDRANKDTVIGHFILQGGAKGNVIHQPVNLFQGMTSIIEKEFANSGFNLADRSNAELIITPALKGLEAYSHGFQGGSSSLKLHIVLKDRGETIIDHVYEADETVGYFGGIGLRHTEFSDSALRKATESIMNDIVADLKDYMSS